MHPDYIIFLFIPNGQLEPSFVSQGATSRYLDNSLLHFVAFFHIASLFSTGVDNEKALELDNRIFFFIFQPDFNVEISPKNATKHPVA